MKGEYLVFFVPIIMGILVIVYFFYHMLHTKQFSKYVLNFMQDKIDKLEETEIEPDEKTHSIIERFKKLVKKNNLYVFDVERKLGIDMESLQKRIDKVIKENKKK